MRRATVGLVPALLVTCAIVASVAAAPPPSLLAVVGGLPKLPAGDPGSIAVVAQGQYRSYGAGNILPIVLRNNTKRSVSIHVGATALDGKGQLIVSGEDQGVHPEVVVPGGLAIGFVRFGSIGIPAGARFKLDVTATPAGQVDGFTREVDVPITTVRYAGGKVVGVARNSTTKKVSPQIIVFAACFSRSNRLVMFGKAFGKRSTAAPGQTVPFAVDFTGKGKRPVPACAHVLVSMTGYSEL